MDASFIPGLLHAAEICDQFENENFSISTEKMMLRMQYPDLQVPGGDGSWSLSLSDHEHIHCCKAHAAREIAAFLRRLASEGSKA